MHNLKEYQKALIEGLIENTEWQREMIGKIAIEDAVKEVIDSHGGKFSATYINEAVIDLLTKGLKHDVREAIRRLSEREEIGLDWSGNFVRSTVADR